jgi:GT2 family glycosyltransferase
MVDVSVVIPTKDRPALLLTALKSALTQHGVTSEVIVVDDGSERVVNLECAPSARVVLQRHRDPRGVSAARNTGIAHAKGTWIAFLDDDDVWAPAKLARQVAAATAADRDWVYAGYVDVDDSLELMGGTPPADPEEVMDLLPSHNSVPAGASNVLVRSATLARAGGFDTGLGVHEDWDLWIRLGRMGPPACVREPLVALRWHTANVSSEISGLDRMLRALPRIAARHEIPVDYPRHFRWAAWTALTSGYRSDAIRWYVSAARHGDLSSLGRAAVAWARPQSALRRTACRSLSDWAMAADEWLRGLR